MTKCKTLTAEDERFLLYHYPNREASIVGFQEPNAIEELLETQVFPIPAPLGCRSRLVSRTSAPVDDGYRAELFEPYGYANIFRAAQFVFVNPTTLRLVLFVVSDPQRSKKIKVWNKQTALDLDKISDRRKYVVKTLTQSYDDITAGELFGFFRSYPSLIVPKATAQDGLKILHAHSQVGDGGHVSGMFTNARDLRGLRARLQQLQAPPVYTFDTRYVWSFFCALFFSITNGGGAPSAVCCGGSVHHCGPEQ